MSPTTERRICGLCGTAYVLILPPGEEPAERDKLCSECLTLPPPPDQSG